MMRTVCGLLIAFIASVVIPFFAYAYGDNHGSEEGRSSTEDKQTTAGELYIKVPCALYLPTGEVVEIELEADAKGELKGKYEYVKGPSRDGLIEVKVHETELGCGNTKLPATYNKIGPDNCIKCDGFVRIKVLLKEEYLYKLIESAKSTADGN